MKNDPRQISAKFDSICPETGKEIKEGDQVIYYPLAKKAYHLESEQAQEYREWKADLDQGFAY